MNSPIGFRTGKTSESHPGSLMDIHPLAGMGTPPSRTADYAYRIAALTAGLILLATVM